MAMASVATSGRPSLVTTLLISGKLRRVLAISLLTSIDCVSAIPGSLRDVISIDPSSSFGMNSVPMYLSEKSAAPTMKRATVRENAPARHRGIQRLRIRVAQCTKPALAEVLALCCLCPEEIAGQCGNGGQRQNKGAQRAAQTVIAIGRNIRPSMP